MVKDRATIYLVHHSLTPGDGTAREVVHGWNGDGITAEGKSLLKKTADYLSDKNIGETYSSDLTRSVQTAEEIRRLLAIDHPNTERRGLRPMDIGVYAGLPKTEVEDALEDLRSRRWAKAPGGESYGKFLGRYGQELHRTIQEALGEEYNCAYVTHSHNFGATPHLLSGGTAPTSLAGDVSEGGVALLHVSGSGRHVAYEPVFDPQKERDQGEV